VPSPNTTLQQVYWVISPPEDSVLSNKVREMETKRFESIEGCKKEARVGDMKISEGVLSTRAFMVLVESTGQETERIKEE
jgi:hypothetical protein